MTDQKSLLDEVRAALRSEPRIDLHRMPLHLQLEDGVLTMEGEVANVAAKKLALQRGVALDGVSAIIDRLRVKPAQAMGDGALRDHLCRALLDEPALREASILERRKGEVETLRESPLDKRGAIEVSVADGVVTLNGQLQGLDEKRLVGLLAWWVPGSRDVINGIAVDPPEEDSPDAIAEAVRLALERDPFVGASQIRVGVRRSVVTLSGIVPTEAEREMAEFDAWYVFAVDQVVNWIEVGGD